jgi:hypothetical protein
MGSRGVPIGTTCFAITANKVLKVIYIFYSWSWIDLIFDCSVIIYINSHMIN